ncbi:hypothetical protein SY83_08430 [Paenibacillus swuensis]|uniref:50S ribosomal protein L33 n=1 Tax=Paenibacillus swuensis TaxID=1178515 RepID=A0A172TH62_9BACL|nr:hypothetical protein [Paenibacillus swuensis]ANE46296.1 hypothetical protein SY83_08430 [Paenibacillus swuensis]
MRKTVTKQQARELLGKNIYALKKDGTVVTGKLVRIKGSELVLQRKSKKAKTTAFIPLVLFDLLAIGTGPFGGGFGGGFGGPFGGGFGGPFGGGGFGGPFGGGFGGGGFGGRDPFFF